MAARVPLSAEEQIAKQANYSALYGNNTGSASGYKLYKQQRSQTAKKMDVKRNENPNYIASTEFGQGTDVDPYSA
jgi:hypothetical protein